MHSISGFGCRSAVVFAALAIALLASAEEGADSDPPAHANSPSVGDSPTPAPPVGLDALLRLPNSPIPAAQQGGQGSERQRWETRFATIRAEVAEARAGLSSAQTELESMARDSESWQMAAPGAQHDPETSPISHKLRNEIREHREDIARAERRLRELEVEASLAGVPAEWRRAPIEDASPGS